MMLFVFLLWMLCIAAMGSGQNRYYTSLAQASYYSDGGEPPGHWCGRGATALGLSGEVEPEDLRALFQGFDPHDGQPLVQNAGRMTGDRSRKPGWDWVFHIPKDASVLWALSDQETQHAIQEAALEAVEETIRFLEEEAAFSAMGKGGCEQVPAKLVVAIFPHGSSRSLDADYHHHCLILNVGVCEDGKPRSLLSTHLYRWSPVACRYFRLALENKLRTRLGIRPKRAVQENGDKRPWWSIPGMPKGLARLFSKRSDAMKEYLGQKGLESAAAATVAALATRPAKDVIPPRNVLFQRWRREAQEAGYSLDWIPRVLGHYRTINPSRGYRWALETALKRITASRSHFCRRELLQAVLEESMGRGLHPETVRHWVQYDLTHDRRFVNLGVRNGQKRFTTQAILQIEKRLLESVDTLRNAKFRPVADRIVDKALRRATADGKRIQLNEEQTKAVKYLTQSAGRIKALTGLAGTGKTTMLRVAREAFEKAGYQVHGCALAGVAAKKLQQGSGIPSDTLAMTLARLYPSAGYLVKHHLKQLNRARRKQPTYTPDTLKLNRKSVIVMDESSMVGTRDFALLVRAVRKANAHLVCLGDHRQLPSIEAGGAFGTILNCLDSLDLKQITRQEKESHRDRVKKLSRGEAEEVVKAYAREGCFHVAQNRTQAQERIVRDWADKGGVNSPDAHVMFAATNREVSELNTLAQKQLLLAGKLNPAYSLTIDNQTIYQGDRVIFTRKSRRIGTNGVENGDQGVVTGVRTGPLADQIAVRLDGEKHATTITVRTLLKTHYDHFRLGYAHTVHRMQGSTVDHSYCLLGGGTTDREMTYVQASRHRKTLSLYSDQNECGVALTNLAREATGDSRRLKPQLGVDPDYSPLIRQMTRSRAQELAHDVLAENVERDELKLEIDP